MKLNKCILTDLGSVNRGKSKHRPRNDESLFGGEYPFIQTGEVKSANFYLNTFSETYNKKGLAQSKLWKKGTLLITIAANIAETAILDIEACFPDSIIGFIPYENKSDVKFVKYYLDYIKRKLQIISQGTTQDNMSVEKLTSMPLFVPDYNIQVKIGKLLSNYDDLIENNNKRIKLLEQTAEELFKEWFVRLRFPNYQNTEIEDGIPQGWKEKTINKLCEVTSSKRIFSSEYIEKGIPFFRGKEITLKSNNKSIDDILYIKQEKYEEIKKSFGIPKEKDILLTAVGTIGSIYSVKKSDDEFYFKDGNLIWLKNFNNEVEYFIYYFMKSEEIQNKLKNISIGSSQKALTIDSIKKITVIVPTNDIIILFNKLIEPILKEIELLQQKNQTLKQTRDLLLPRLISGKLDIEKLDIN
ncbi:restriction endonuclease subunit S [Malaciobacter marinus]|uniref:restriction endonuclease subunit S n=1 Tax=Malaciobacter marinus TaxID=505249 RepID=UPI003B0070B7